MPTDFDEFRPLSPSFAEMLGFSRLEWLPPRRAGELLFERMFDGLAGGVPAIPISAALKRDLRVLRRAILERSSIDEVGLRWFEHEEAFKTGTAPNPVAGECGTAVLGFYGEVGQLVRARRRLSIPPLLATVALMRRQPPVPAIAFGEGRRSIKVTSDGQAVLDLNGVLTFDAPAPEFEQLTDLLDRMPEPDAPLADATPRRHRCR